MSLIRLTRPGGFRPERLFRPAQVALIGQETEPGQRLAANLRAGGYKGALHLLDTGALPPEPVDLAILAIDANAVAATRRSLAESGAGAVIVAGPAPGLGRAGDIATIGPRAFGLAVPSLGLNATTSHIAARSGRLALVAESAGLCRAVLDWAEPNGVGFSHVIGLGAHDDVGFSQSLDWLAHDPGTGAILLEIGRLRNPRHFLLAARACARTRPVVAICAGGRLADPSGRSEQVFLAAMLRAGVIAVTRLEELLAAAETLSRARRLRHETLAIVTNAAGPGRLAADAALREGIRLATPGEAHCRALEALAPGAAAGALSHVPLGGILRLAEAASMLGADASVGAVLVMIAPSGEMDDAGVDAVAAAARALDKPLLTCVMGEASGAGFRRKLADRGLAVFTTPEQAVAGFFHMLQDRRAREAARELPSSRVLSIDPDAAAVDRIFAAVRADGRDSLAQDEALAVLAAYGLPVVAGRVAASADAAVKASLAVGFPAVVKPRRTVRPDPMGRGRVVLALRDAASVRFAAAEQLRDGTASELLVQRQAPRARELLIRTGDDPMFGPSITFGAGGTTADVLDDVAAALPPLNLTLAHALLRRTRTWRTLGAFHDRAAADIDAVAASLVRVSQLLIDRPEIAEIEINPLLAGPDGVLAVDAWIRLRPPGETRGVALPPYPADLAEAIEVNGQAYTLRPIRPEDATAHAEFFARLTPQDVRYRFFSALRALSSEQLARMTQVDYEREIAFIALREADGATVGVARLVREPGQAEAEFAIVVEASAKGTGLARRLMERLIEWAREKRVGVVAGQVLADNAPMLAFVGKLGFTVRRMEDDPEVMEAKLVL